MFRKKKIEELKFLYETGIEVVIHKIISRLDFVVIGILGDNLGLNALLGFTESLFSDYFCRFCRASKYLCYILYTENSELLRTTQNYN